MTALDSPTAWLAILGGTLAGFAFAVWMPLVSGCLGYCPDEPPPESPPTGLFFALPESIPEQLETDAVEVEITHDEVTLRYDHAQFGPVEVVYAITDEPL